MNYNGHHYGVNGTNAKGEYHGVFRDYYLDDGQLACIGHYLNGISVGYWTHFRKNGDIYKKVYKII